MTLSALLVCVDEAAAEVLRRVLEELTIRVEFCPDFVRAGIRLAQERFDVIIVDGELKSEVISLLRETRLSRVNDATLAVAVVREQENIREMFSLGVNFVLYKPVAYERALSSLRAARAVMRKEKRKSVRKAVHTHATIDYANVEQEKATLVDLAEDGMAVQFGKKLPPVNKVYFQFRLPGQASSVRLSGQIIWQDWKGRGGIQFVDVPKASRKLLTEFLGTSHANAAKREALPDVTVEMDDPLQAVMVSAGEQTHGSEGGEDGAQRLMQHEAVADSADPHNRREKKRYSCRLSAEVYQIGTPVPHHCCLTDVSGGGCYLEVGLPFPQGAPVEILVRTYEMKLRLQGKVQASHPGFGMGVAFELNTKEERANVITLLQFVAATTENS